MERMTTIKVSPETHAKLNLLKNRYDFIEEKKHKWDEFLNILAQDALFMLSIKFHRKNPKLDVQTISIMLAMDVDNTLHQLLKIIIEKEKSTKCRVETTKK